MKQLGDCLKELRLTNTPKLSQKEFGKKFGLSESTIGMYERSERNLIMMCFKNSLSFIM